MATKTKTAKAKAAKADPAADQRDKRFNQRVVALDGLLRVASMLALKIETEDDWFQGMDSDLNAIWGVLPILADSLSSHGPGHYDFKCEDMAARPVADLLENLAALIRDAG